MRKNFATNETASMKCANALLVWFHYQRTSSRTCIVDMSQKRGTPLCLSRRLPNVSYLYLSFATKSYRSVHKLQFLPLSLFVLVLRLKACCNEILRPRKNPKSVFHAKLYGWIRVEELRKGRKRCTFAIPKNNVTVVCWIRCRTRNIENQCDAVHDLWKSLRPCFGTCVISTISAQLLKFLQDYIYRMYW